MAEGCLADFAIKPKKIDEDKWLMVQMKNTSKPLRDYGFTPLNIINRTPKGHPVQCSRATLPENQLYQAPIKDGRPDSNVHRCKCSNRYHDCAILCVCLSDKRMWLLNGNEITVSKKIAIGLKKSKYSINEITTKTIVQQLTNYYDNLPLLPYNVINIYTPGN